MWIAASLRVSLHFLQKLCTLSPFSTKMLGKVLQKYLDTFSFAMTILGEDLAYLGFAEVFL